MAESRSVTPPRNRSALIALLMCIWLIDGAGLPHAQRWREEPGRQEFTGKMVARPLQIEHWMERGFTREQAEALDQRACRVSSDCEYTFPPLN